MDHNYSSPQSGTESVLTLTPAPRKDQTPLQSGSFCDEGGAELVKTSMKLLRRGIKSPLFDMIDGFEEMSIASSSNSTSWADMNDTVIDVREERRKRSRSPALPLVCDYSQPPEKYSSVTNKECNSSTSVVRLERRSKPKPPVFKTGAPFKSGTITELKSEVTVFEAGGRKFGVRKTVWRTPQQKEIRVRIGNTPVYRNGRIESLSMHSLSIPFKCNPQNIRNTTVCKPFSFDERDKVFLAKKQARIANNETTAGLSSLKSFCPRPAAVPRNSLFVPHRIAKDSTQPWTPKLHGSSSNKQDRHPNQAENSQHKVQNPQSSVLRKSFL